MILSNFVRGSPVEYACEIVSKSALPFRGRSHLNVFCFKFLWPSCSAEWNNSAILINEHPKNIPVKFLGIGGILLKSFGPVRKSFFLNLNMLQFHLRNCVIIVHVLKNFQLYAICSQKT